MNRASQIVNQILPCTRQQMTNDDKVTNYESAFDTLSSSGNVKRWIDKVNLKEDGRQSKALVYFLILSSIDEYSF